MRYRTNEEKMKKDILEVIQSIAALMIFIGVICISVNETGITAVVAVTMIIVGSIFCIISELWLDSMNQNPDFSEDELKEMIGQLDKPKKSRNSGDYKYYPEYTFIQYLADHHHLSIEEFIKFVDEIPNPNEYFNNMYNDYKASAGRNRIQSMEQVQSIIWRQMRRQ